MVVFLTLAVIILSCVCSINFILLIGAQRQMIDMKKEFTKELEDLDCDIPKLRRVGGNRSS